MDNKSFAAACMAATLVTAWAATPTEAASADYYLKIDTIDGETMEAATVVWGSGTLSLAGNGGLLSPSSSWQGTLAINGDTADYSMPWAVVAAIDGAPGHVAVCMPGLTLVQGIEFSAIFQPAVYHGDEQLLYNELLSSSTTGQISSFVSDFLIQARDQYGNGQTGDSATNWMFSQAQDIGSMTFSLVPVPEPTTALAAFGAALVIGRRRRRTLVV